MRTSRLSCTHGRPKAAASASRAAWSVVASPNCAVMTDPEVTMQFRYPSKNVDCWACGMRGSEAGPKMVVTCSCRPLASVEAARRLRVAIADCDHTLVGRAGLLSWTITLPGPVKSTVASMWSSVMSCPGMPWHQIISVAPYTRRSSASIWASALPGFRAESIHELRLAMRVPSPSAMTPPPSPTTLGTVNAMPL